MASDFKKRMLEKNKKPVSVAEEIKQLEPNRETGKKASDAPVAPPAPRREPATAKADKAKGKPAGAPTPPSAASQGAPKRTVVTLLPEQDRFIRIRAKQLNVSLDRYINLLVDEDRDLIGEGRTEEESMELYDKIKKKYQGSKEKMNISFTKENLEFLIREKTAAALNLTDYMNYLVEKEMIREKEQGKRQSCP